MSNLDDYQVWRSILADHEKTCMLIGMKFKLFEIVNENPSISLDDLIKQCGFGKKCGEAIITVLTATGYLKVDAGEQQQYNLTEMAKKFMLVDSAYTYKPLLDYYEIEENILKTIVSDNKTGTGWDIVDDWETGNVDAKEAAKFSALMQSISLDAAEYLARNVNLKEKFNINGILDVAGGTGCYCSAFASAQPGTKCVLFELDEVCKVSQTYIEKSDAPASSVLTYSGDMFREPFPFNSDPVYGYQAIFFSNIIHDWDEKRNDFLLKKSFDALPSNGWIMLHEALLNDDGTGPLVNALYSFDMSIISKGKQYKLKELREILTKAGFVDVTCLKVYGIYSLVYARKP